MAITRLLAEWELRVRRVQLEGNEAQPGQPARAGNAAILAARERVIQQLAALGPLALEPLTRALRPAAATNLLLGRAALAALALGRMGDARAAPALLAALRDQRPGCAPLRVAAASALGELKAEAAATLYAQTTAHQNDAGRAQQTERLEPLRLEAVIAALAEALRDPAPGVRAGAASACIDLCQAEPLQPPGPGLSSIVGPLSQALKDADAGVRAHAATALGWIGDQSAAAPLTRCLKDADEQCRAAAARALGMLRSPLALKPLARALGDASVIVRQQVAEALGELGDPITAEVLLDVLGDEAEPLKVRAAAAWALGNLHLPQALPIFRELLGAPEPALRVAAIEALGRLRFGRAYRLIVPLLWRDPDRAVRHAAARAVAQLAQARQSRARWRLCLALRVSRQARKEALMILADHARQTHQALRER